MVSQLRRMIGALSGLAERKVLFRLHFLNLDLGLVEARARELRYEKVSGDSQWCANRTSS